MASELLERTAALRDEAWDAVKASKPYAVFKALDDATLIAGGDSALAGPVSAPRVMRARKRRNATPLSRSNANSASARVSHGDAAEKALREACEPLPTNDLMDASILKGAQISGSNPVNNFRSTISRDNRFHSVQRNNVYFWWFEGEPLPPTWNETTGPDLLNGPVVSSARSNQEGGDGHGPATT